MDSPCKACFRELCSGESRKTCHRPRRWRLDQPDRRPSWLVCCWAVIWNLLLVLPRILRGNSPIEAFGGFRLGRAHSKNQQAKLDAEVAELNAVLNEMLLTGQSTFGPKPLLGTVPMVPEPPFTEEEMAQVLLGVQMEQMNRELLY
jgi:hypothetical protein